MTKRPSAVQLLGNLLRNHIATLGFSPIPAKNLDHFPSTSPIGFFPQAARLSNATLRVLITTEPPPHVRPPTAHRDLP